MFPLVGNTYAMEVRGLYCNVCCQNPCLISLYTFYRGLCDGTFTCYHKKISVNLCFATYVHCVCMIKLGCCKVVTLQHLSCKIL
jgi:hypothetical protein